MDKKELDEKLSQLKKAAAEKRKKRALKVTAAFVVVYFVAFCFFENTPNDFNDFFGYCLASVILAVLHYAINDAIFENLHQRNESEEREIREIRKQLSELSDKELDEYIKKYKNKHIKGGDAEKNNRTNE